MLNQHVPFDEYLKRNQIEKGEKFTHTRIGDKDSKIIGGSYNIKDSSNFLPGHGGFFDRFDSFLSSIIFLTLYSYIFL